MNELTAEQLEIARTTYGLTSRELDIIRAVCCGLSNREISQELRTAEHPHHAGYLPHLRQNWHFYANRAGL